MAYNAIGGPRLGSFKNAVDWHNKVKPIRGNAEQVRPLGERRYHHAANIIMPDPDTVVLNYHGNELVEWRSDNTFTLHAPKYYSAYSGEQIIGFVPRGMEFSWEKGRLFVKLFNGKNIELARRQSLKFAPTEKTYYDSPIFDVVDAPDVKVYRVKRGVADAIVKRRFGAFLEWVAMTSSIVSSASHEEIKESRKKYKAAAGYTDELLSAVSKAVEHLPWGGERERVSMALNDVHHIPYSSRRQGGAFHRASSELLAEWMSDNNTECWLDALNVIQNHVGEHLYGDYSGRKRGVHISVLRVYGYVKGIAAFLHRDEAFKITTMPAGIVPSKCNAEYFREISIDFGQTDSVSECS
jgi:hypothetical protein